MTKHTAAHASPEAAPATPMPAPEAAPAGMTAVTSEIFDDAVLRAPVPVVVDFWATWCGPCRRLAPVLEDLAARYAGKVKVVKIDAERAPDVAQRYRVMSMPTVLVFRDGQVVAQMVGFSGRRRVEALFEDAAA